MLMYSSCPFLSDGGGTDFLVVFGSVFRYHNLIFITFCSFHSVRLYSIPLIQFVIVSMMSKASATSTFHVVDLSDAMMLVSL